MTIEAVASMRHLQDHIAPIWCALDPDERGRFFVGTMGRHAAAYLRDRYGIEHVQPGYPHDRGGLTLAANHADYDQCTTRPVAYVEHGAGQTYAEWPTHPSFSGSHEHQRVVLYLTLNEQTAARELAANPAATVAVVGSPRLDWLANVTRGRRGSRPRVAFAFHWNSEIVPETRSAFRHWHEALAELAKSGRYELLGHGHPRAWHELERWYLRAGIEPVRDFADVVARADVVCFDNTSAGYEAAALGIPVIALDAPWYRRDVDHGLRFWDRIPGPTVGGLDGLRSTLQRMLAGDPWRHRRQAVVDTVYPVYTRGCAAELARDALRATKPLVSSRS